MSKVLVTESYLSQIANAIRSKLGGSTEYRPGDMANAIESIPTGGITPTGTKQITQNGTHDVTEYASANVNVPNSYAAGDEGKVVSNGALVAQTSRSLSANGTYDTTTNNEVVVNVSGGGGIPLLSRADWRAMSTAQKRAYGLVAIQDANTGYKRGDLVNGADYVGGIVQSGTAASSASFTVDNTGEYTLVVIAMNSEASSKTLEIDATQNSVAVSHDLYTWHDYQGSGNNRRNYRLATFDISAQTGDVITIDLTQRSGYTSFVWALIDGSITIIANALTSADAATSGTYSNDAVVMYGTFDSDRGGTITLEQYIANATVSTQNPGTNYKSSYIFWVE